MDYFKIGDLTKTTMEKQENGREIGACGIN